MEEKAGQEWKRLREDLDKKTPSTKNHEKNTKDHEQGNINNFQYQTLLPSPMSQAIGWQANKY